MDRTIPIHIPPVWGTDWQNMKIWLGHPPDSTRSLGLVGGSAVESRSPVRVVTNNMQPRWGCKSNSNNNCNNSSSNSKGARTPWGPKEEPKGRGPYSLMDIYQWISMDIQFFEIQFFEKPWKTMKNNNKTMKTIHFLYCFLMPFYAFFSSALTSIARIPHNPGIIEA